MAEAIILNISIGIVPFLVSYSGHLYCILVDQKYSTLVSTASQTVVAKPIVDNQYCKNNHSEVKSSFYSIKLLIIRSFKIIKCSR